MSALNDLISQIDNPDLRDRIQQEVNKLNKQKKFGLVFEEHLPEATPLYDIPVKRGTTVAKRADIANGSINETWSVIKIDGENAICIQPNSSNAVTFAIADLVPVTEFGEAIYPYLKPIDTVCNAPDSDLWHTLIEADNYHALQLLEYLYAGKVDCIYIDPPYNSGAKDWKYNNDYVDGNDAYRHSKWLSMMEKRLRLAKRLLNHDDSVLLVTIDEKEYASLGLLLNQLFPSSDIQMVSITINPSGAVRKNLFARADEYMYIVLLGNAHVIQPKGDGEETEVRWWYLRRLEYSSRREAGRPLQFYPIYIDANTNKIVKIGTPLGPGVDRNSVEKIEGLTTVFPIRDDGLEMVWGVTGSTLENLLSEKVVQVLPNPSSPYQPYTIKYLSENYTKKIKDGRWAEKGFREDGSKIIVETGGKITRPTTVWKDKSYESKQNGTIILKNLIGPDKFSFPKSLYAVSDSLRYFTADKPNALILDFFAGSGTTLHAVNLLNAEDGGHRRCILVTNNEVSDSEQKKLLSAGLTPIDKKWEDLGIAHYVTWPRTVCSIEGHDINNNPLTGNYLGSGRPMSDGFKANAAFFKLSFLDKQLVSLGRRFSELLPVLWMKAGAVGPCPSVDKNNLPDMLVLPENQFAVLLNETKYPAFEAALEEHPEIQTVFINTDYEPGYQAMTKYLHVQNTFQLYRDYLDFFRLNVGRR